MPSTLPRARGGPRPRRRRPARVVLPAALVLVLTACSGEQSALDPRGPFAQKPDDLFMMTFWIAVAVFVLVQGLIIFTAVKYRQRKDDDTLPVQTHGNTRLEIFWTVVPAVILAAIAVPTIQQVFDLAEEPDGAMVVEVVGHRWWWEYRYPGTGVTTANELVMPVDRPVRLEMTADDPGAESQSGVIHSYWIPALAGKQDVVPGRTTTLNLQADETGRYLGQCAEYCGLSHANMRNRAVVLEPDEFDQWIGDQQQPAAEPEEGTLAAEGRDLLLGDGEGNRLSCVACHTIRTEAVDGESGFTDTTGPDLTHLMSRREFGGAIFDLYERQDPDDPNSAFTDQVNTDQLRAWVRDAPSMKAMRPAQGYSMPSFVDSLSDEQLDAIVAYLTTLE